MNIYLESMKRKEIELQNGKKQLEQLNKALLHIGEKMHKIEMECMRLTGHSHTLREQIVKVNDAKQSLKILKKNCIFWTISLIPLISILLVLYHFPIPVGILASSTLTISFISSFYFFATGDMRKIVKKCNVSTLTQQITFNEKKYRKRMEEKNKWSKKSKNIQNRYYLKRIEIENLQYSLQNLKNKIGILPMEEDPDLEVEASLDKVKTKTMQEKKIIPFLVKQKKA